MAKLEADYNAAVAAGNWPEAAKLLNGFNDSDIQSRLKKLSKAQLTSLYGGAGGYARITSAVDAFDPTVRVAKLEVNYSAAVAAANWPEAAKLLNGFNDADIDKHLKALPGANLLDIDAGAIKGTFDRVHNAALKLAGPGGAYGKLTISQSVSNGSASSPYSSPVTITFKPHSAKANATQIAFVQSVRLVDTATGNTKDWDPTNLKRMSAGQTSVDRIPGRKYGWYGLNNDGTPSGTLTPGSSPSPLADAVMQDTPSAKIPNTTWQFDTCAIAKEGPDKGTVYSSVQWGFTVDATYKVTAMTAKIEDKGTSEWSAAAGAWNTQAKGPAADRNAPDQEELGPFK